MTAAQAFFAVMAAGARIGARHVPWPEVCASRFLVGGMTAYAVAALRGVSLRITSPREAWVRSGFGTLAAAGTFFVFAAPRLAIGDAATLFATTPLFVALLSAPLLAEKVPRASALALVLGFVGIALVAQPSFSTAGHVVAIAAASAVASAIAMIWLRRIGPNESGEAIVFHFACVGLGAMLLLAIPVWKTPDARELLVLGGTGLSAGIAQLMMTRAYSLDRASTVSVLGYSGVVFTRLLAVPVFGEVPDAIQIAGSLLVIASGVLLALRGAHHGPPAAGAAPGERAHTVR